MRVNRLFLASTRGDRVGCIAALVLEQVAQILVGRDPEQPSAARESQRELEIGEIGAPVAAAQPVLLLGEIVVADSGAMQLAQRRLGRAEKLRVAMRFGDVQRQAVDPAAHQRVPPGKQQWRGDPELPGNGQRAPLARE